jgi:hypothetical protein
MKGVGWYVRKKEKIGHTWPARRMTKRYGEGDWTSTVTACNADNEKSSADARRTESKTSPG